RRGEEPGDFWSQSFCYGSTEIGSAASAVQIRFRNNAGKNYLRAEASVLYRTASKDATQVRFDWSDADGHHASSHLFTADNRPPWLLKTGKNVQTRWVEFSIVPQ